jgi:integrase
VIKSYKYKNKTYYLIQLSYTDHQGKRYQPKYRFDQNGQRISSERTAKLLEAHFLKDLISEIEGNKLDITFNEWHSRFLSQIKLSYRRGTVMQYDGDLKKWLYNGFGYKILKDYTKSDIHSFIFETLQQNGATPNLQNKIRKTLARIFESAIEEGLISRNPCNGIKVKVPPTSKLVLNHHEVLKLLSEAKALNHDFYYHWSVVLFSGLRNGEIYGLRWSDIDLVSGIITTKNQWTNKDGYHSTKSNKTRIVPISSELKKILIELKNLGPFSENLTGLNGNNQFFDDLVLPRSTEWKHGEQASILKRFCKSIGITEIKFHDLRATFITNALTHGVTLPQVMAIVGHSRTSTTDEYLRLAGVSVKGVTDKISYSVPNDSEENVLLLGINNQ